MASTTQTSHAHPGPQLDNRRVAAAAIDLAPPALAAIALLAGNLLTPAVALVLLGWTLYYFFALESGGGQTIGKRLMHLRVVSADGRRPTMRQYASRNAVRAVDLPVVGLVAMLTSGDSRQRLGDRAAGTMVVEAEPSSPDIDPLAATSRLEPFMPAGPDTEPMPKKARRSLGGPEIKLPKLARSKKPAATATEASAPAVPAEPKPKSSRRSLGGPEIKLPKLGRPKRDRPAPVAATPGPARPSRPTLGGPEIKLPKLRRSRKPDVAPAAVVDAPAEPKPKSSRRTLGGPEIKLPKLGRRKRAPEPPAEPAPEVPRFDPFSEDAPAPAVEVVQPDDGYEDYDDLPDPDADAVDTEVLSNDVPDVRVVQPRPEPELPARRHPAVPDVPEADGPQAPRPPAIPAIPAQDDPADDEPIAPAASMPAPEPEPDPVPAAASEPEPDPEPSEAMREDGSPRLNVKPIETVSPLELLMQEAEQRERPDDDSSL